MQGGHQVAQKFKTTTCPLNWLNVTERSESFTVKSGAAEPIRDGRDPLQQPDSAGRIMNRIIVNGIKPGATGPAREPARGKMRRTQL